MRSGVFRVGALGWRCNSLGLAVGPAVDIDPAIGGGMSYDLLLPECRKIVWALIVVGLPCWVHAGFPCTFWTPMAHLTRKHDPASDENTRIEQLVFSPPDRKMAALPGQTVLLREPPFVSFMVFGCGRRHDQRIFDAYC